MTRTLTLLAVVLAASAVPQVSQAVACTAPVTQNCSFLYEGERMTCELFVGTATPPNGTWACINSSGDGTIHIGP